MTLPDDDIRAFAALDAATPIYARTDDASVWIDWGALTALTGSVPPGPGAGWRIEALKIPDDPHMGATVSTLAGTTGAWRRWLDRLGIDPTQPSALFDLLDRLTEGAIPTPGVMTIGGGYVGLITGPDPADPADVVALVGFPLSDDAAAVMRDEYENETAFRAALDDPTGEPRTVLRDAERPS